MALAQTSEHSSPASIDIDWEFDGMTNSQMENLDEAIARIGRARSASPSLRAPRALSQHSSFSEFGADPIDDLILEVNEDAFSAPPPATQKSTSSESTVGLKSGSSTDSLATSITSNATSTSSLGKRTSAEAPCASEEGPSKRLCRPTGGLALPAHSRQPLERSASLDYVFRDKVSAKRSSSLAAELDADKPYIIAHSVNLLTMMNKRNIPYGVRYEIARYMSLNIIAERDVGMDQIAKLQALGSSNAEAAPHVLSVLRSKNESDADAWDSASSSKPTLFDKEIAARSPWAELDKEEALIPDCKSRKGVGFQDLDNPEWFGGKISFRGFVKHENSELKIVLEQPELGSSDRFGRAFGSKSRITLKVSSTRGCTREKLLLFLKRPFIIWDVVYRAFLEDDGNVFFIATDEVMNSVTERIDPTRRDPTRMGFLDFIDWHNPLYLNPKQAMAKWAARFNLGRSTSVPGLILQRHNILYEDDIGMLEAVINCVEIEAPTVSPQGSDMTDGCGFINLAGLKTLCENLHLGDFPAAVQCRIAGAKGLLVRHPIDTSEEVKVWLRPSMIKVKHPMSAIASDITLRTLDVLKASHPPSNGRLNYQTIINLAENGVPEQAFDNLVRTRLEEMAEVFTTCDSGNVDDQQRIWKESCTSGGVMGARLARRRRDLARLVGYQKSRADDLETEGDSDLSTPQSTPWEWDQTSGQPSSLAETVMAALDSGLYDVPAFREKLRNMVGILLEQYALSYRTEIPMSLVAFIAPDPTGSLKPGQIFFKSSRRTLEQPSDPTSDTVLGPVLITRNPCRLPTDVQKWDAVDIPELRNHLDVIYLSVQGNRRAADFLAGDYDGDTALLIWQPEFVEPFRNADLRFADEPANLRKEYFLPVVETVADFERRTRNAKVLPGSSAYIHSLQDHLLGNLLSNSAVGKYSQLHEAACYEKGYSDPDTIRLAYMFCLILDGSKSGLRVNADKMKIDIQKFKVAEMVWRERLAKDFKTRAYAGGSTNEDNRRSAKRGPGMKAFIMDHMHSFGKSENVRIGELLNKHMGGDKLKTPPDAALLEPWRDAERRAEKAKTEHGITLLAEELEAVKEHVERIYKMHRSEFGNGSRSPSKKLLMSPSKKNSRAALSDLPIEQRQDRMRKVSLAFQQPISGREMICFSGQTLNELKASYAYQYDYEQNQGSWSKCFSHYPWDVAFRDLCAIKARSMSGGWKAVRVDFYENMMVKIRT